MQSKPVLKIEESSEPPSPRLATFHRFQQLSVSTSALDDKSLFSGETIIKTIKKVVRVESNHNVIRCQKIIRHFLKKKAISQWEELFMVLKNSPRSKATYGIIKYEIEFYSQLIFFFRKFKVPLGFILSPVEVDEIFSDFESLKNCLKVSLSMFRQYSVPKVFSETSLQHMKIYSSLVANLETHFKTYFSWRTKPAFVSFEQNYDKHYLNKSLVDFVMSPFYRLKHLHQHFLDLKENTPSNYIDYDAIVVTFNSLQTLWDQLNTNRECLTNFEETKKVKSVIPNLQHPLISTWRKLLKQGELYVRTPSTKKNKLYEKFYVFLFVDLLIMCKPLPNNQYSRQEILRVERISAVDEIAADKSLLEIKLWQSTNKPIEKYLINAASISDRKDWEESIQTARKLIANTDFFVIEDGDGLF